MTFKRENMSLAFSWVSCLILLNLDISTWYLCSRISLEPLWISTRLVHISCALS
uniref:Uncharacterized protein n=1 Tax=Arundo donax TaxID=35708 RepID=A0A0A9ADW2_ARUDO